tara:strand:- start:283 stop:408 length:126 start_codon:yes stop_codon:yes gene_type:complete
LLAKLVGPEVVMVALAADQLKMQGPRVVTVAVAVEIEQVVL